MTRVPQDRPDPQGRDGLHTRLRALFATAPEEQSDDAFERLAHAIFAHQFEHNAPLSAYWRRRGATPDTVVHWTEIPAVPTAAFKEVDLIAGDAAAARLEFRTSGTTAGAERRGRHLVLDPTLYEEALLAAFRAWVLPDGATLRTVSLMPSARELPHSSLAYMIDAVMRRAAAGQHVATVAGGLDVQALERTLRDAERQGEPLCLLGTSLAFVHWLDHARSNGLRFRLPAGSRLMDTGGFKGSGREVAASDLRAAYGTALGIAEPACINEYGMTEMLSQFYDATLRRDGPRRKVPPPWVRTRIVDPDTLRPVSSGPGLLQHFDLANLDSVMAVQTEDLGIAVEDGFEVLGRAAGAPPRGCSIAMDLLLSAVR